MASISAASTSVALSVLPIFPVPQIIQGFATDDVLDIPQIKSVEVLMGVDGRLSGGFVFVQIPQEIILQADSESNLFFDTWWAQMQAAKDVYIAQGVINIPTVASKLIQTNGYLTGYKPGPQVKKLLQPRRYEITWESVIPVPA